MKEQKNKTGYFIAIIFNALYFYGYFIATGRFDIWNNPSDDTRTFAGIVIVVVSFSCILTQILANKEE